MSGNNQNWVALTSVQVGGAICLPVLFIGFELARQVGLDIALIAIGIGNALLFALSLVGAKVSTASQMTTTENAEPFLGKRAKTIFSIVMALSMSLWFGLQTEMMAEDLLMSMPFLMHKKLIGALIAALIVICALSGMRSIERLSNVAVPCMVATLLFALFAARGQGDVPTSTSFSFANISLILGASIGCVVDMPTFFRHAINRKEAYRACIATFLVGIPAVEVMGALLYSLTDAPTLLDALLCFDNVLWRGWIMLFILLAGWTTNNANLYSAAMSIKSLRQHISDKVALASVGIVAVALSLCNIVENLLFFTNAVGVAIGSMGGVVFSSFMQEGRTTVSRNSIALVLGLFGGFGLISGAPIFDAIIIASCATILLQRRKERCQPA